MKLALLFFVSLKLISCHDFDILVNVVKMISNCNHFGFIVILYSQEEEKEKLFYEKLVKLLLIRLKYRMTVRISIEQYTYQHEGKNENLKCLKILNGRSEIVKQKFLNFSKEVNLGDGDMWLIFLNGPSESYLNSLSLPFNVQLIAAISKNVSVDLKAPYKVAKDYPLRIENLGSWTQTGFNVPEITLDVTKRDMEGYRLIAGTINYPPVTTINYYENDKFRVHGYLIDIWKQVSENLNFTYEYILPPDKGVGSKTSDGTWNGLMGMLMRNEIDVIVTALIMTTIRSGDVDFSVPIMTSGFQVFFLEAGNQHLEWGSILRPFSEESWFVILGWLATATISFCIVYSVGCRFNKESYVFKGEYTILGSLFVVFTAFTNQGNSRVPQSLSGRIVFYSVYFAMAILLPSYSAALISYLTVRNPIRPFNSLEGMIKAGTHNIIPAQKTADYSFFSHATEPLLQEAFKKLIEPVQELTLPQNPKEGIEMVCKIKNVAYFGCELSARIFADEFFLKRGCKFMTFEKPVIRIYKGIAFPKGSPYYLAINAELKKIVGKGLLHRYEKEVWAPNIEIPEPRIDAIEPRHVIQIYCTFLGGLFLSICIFIIEKFKSER